MATNRFEPDEDADPGFLVCVREAKIMLIFWLVQSAVMVGLFLLLGYNRTTDPFGFLFGLPSWYVLGGIIPALASLVAVIYLVRRHFVEVDLK